MMWLLGGVRARHSLKPAAAAAVTRAAAAVGARTSASSGAAHAAAAHQHPKQQQLGSSLITTIMAAEAGPQAARVCQQPDANRGSGPTPAVAAAQQQLQQLQQQQTPQQQPQPQQQQWKAEQQHFMQLAFQQARIALKVREIPIGCVVVRDGQVIGTGYNMTNHTRNATRHAEFEAIDRILADHGGDVTKAAFNRCQLYVTIEPCIMCAGALSLLGIAEVFYGAANDKFGGCGSILSVHQSGCGNCSGSEPSAAHGKPYVALGGLFADEAVQLLQMFYVAGNPLAPKPKRTVLEVPPWEQVVAEQQQQLLQQQQEQQQQQCDEQQQQCQQPSQRTKQQRSLVAARLAVMQQPQPLLN